MNESDGNTMDYYGFHSSETLSYIPPKGKRQSWPLIYFVGIAFEAHSKLAGIF